ncbi:TetR/AcrR family transcriptional regulator [Williamsia herbipolensis]|uniref:TetR/AcrR family transcriptional regulator n=1 Tax=Williamsia herbipolensis TaxID=1603258 RepID=A0AAU4JY48_9NOCA|nr:helix-turn-helix domain-containing protein [Williamsia herbipolensis]MCX6469730.1 helix-turn-helix domain containing protein [Mycobacteriales bacterium]
MTIAREGGRSYGGESPVARDERRRRQLLDAGLSIFGSVGFRAATVRGLCREARVADRYFYEQFPGLEDLLLAVYAECVDRMMAAVVDELAALPPDATTVVRASRGLDAFFGVTENPLLARVVWLEVLGVSPRVDRLYLDTLNRFGDLLLSQMRADQQAPVDEAERRVLATAAVGGIRQTGTAWLIDGYTTDRRVLVAASTRFLVAIAESDH